MKRVAGSGDRQRCNRRSEGVPVAAATAALALALFLVAPSAQGTVVAEGTLSWGFDSNVFEAVNRERWVGDTFARIETTVERQGAPRPGGDWHAQVRLACEQYLHNGNQDRNLLLGGIGWRLRGSRAVADWSWTEQLIDRGHADSLSLGRHQLAHTGSAAFDAGTRVGWLVDAVWVDTRAGGPASRWGWRVGGNVQRSLARRWTASALGEVGEVRFDTRAVAHWEAGNLEWGSDQRDRSRLVGLGLSWNAAALVHFSYGYRTVDSNSLGYSQTRHELGLSLAWLLPRRVSLLAIGLWQDPCYEEQDFAKWSLRADPEDLDLGARSSLTLRLRRPLGHGFGAEAQASWERNEARITGKFYERGQVLCSLRYGSNQ